MTKLILVRGLPGSGKSTLAQWLLKAFRAVDEAEGRKTFSWYHFEADMYHIDPETGVYNWQPKNVQKAHEWCQNSVEYDLQRGFNNIVSNTFTRMWEMLPYLRMAKEFGAKVTVITCEGNYGNVHSVPEDVIEKMKARWEPYTPLTDGE